MSEKKKFTLYAGSVALCVCTAVLLEGVKILVSMESKSL